MTGDSNSCKATCPIVNRTGGLKVEVVSQQGGNMNKEQLVRNMAEYFHFSETN